MFRSTVAAEAISGEVPLHSCTLCGKSGGKLGFVTLEFWLRDGAIVVDQDVYFGRAGARRIYFTGATPQLMQSIMSNPGTRSHHPVQLAGQILEAVKKANPFIGGEDQIVMLEGDRSTWVSHPPAAWLSRADSPRPRSSAEV